MLDLHLISRLVPDAVSSMQKHSAAPTPPSPLLSTIAASSALPIVYSPHSHRGAFENLKSNSISPLLETLQSLA